MQSEEKPNSLEPPRNFPALSRDSTRRLVFREITFLLVLLPSTLLGGTAQPSGSGADRSNQSVAQSTPLRRTEEGDPQVSSIHRAQIKLPITDADDLHFNHLPVGEAPSQTRANLIVQDDLGFIWLGTQQGLNRYDGYKFKVFTHDPANPSSMGGVYVYSLFKDRSGTIWVGSDQSLDRFNAATESFTHVHLDPTNPIVLQIEQDSTGVLWMSTPNGLYSVNPTNLNVEHYRHEPGNPFSLSSNDVQTTGEDHEGRFWILTDVGLDQFDRTSGQVVRRILMPGSVATASGCNPDCQSFHIDRFGDFWITHTGGYPLALFDPDTGQFTGYSLYEHGASAVAATDINALLEDHDGTMWFGTMGNGLLKFDRYRKRFVRYRRQLQNPDGLAENRIICLFEDREHDIWIGFHSMMPDHFADRGPRFESFSPAVADPNGTGENLVSAIYVDHQKFLWIAASGVLYRINRETGQYTRYYPAPAGAVSEILTIKEDRRGTLWVGTWGYGLSRLDKATGTFRTYRNNPADPSSLSSDIVTRIAFDHTGTMWLSTFGGLDRFDQLTHKFTTYKRDRDKIEPYYSITEDNRGFLWIGGLSGITRFRPSTGQFTLFPHSAQDPDSLSNNTVDSSLQDHAGNLWIGTQDGLNKMDTQTERFSAYYEKNGLPGNAVSCILEDNTNNLWMSTNRGLSKFDPRTQVFENYSSADGLPGDDLTGWDACYKSPSGELFFGGFAGGVAFHPDQIVDTTYTPPRVVFTDFKLASEDVKIGPDSPLRESITEAKTLTLTHSQHYFSIGFSALSFRSPETNRYRYKMDRLDSAWHEVGEQQRIVNYDSLPAGVYEFHVEGATSRGPWSSDAALRIEILPAWWATTWFRLITIAVTLALLISIYQIRLRNLASQYNVRLEERVNERTRIARDLHDTFFQAVQSLFLRIHTASRQLPEEHPTRQRVEEVLDESDRVMMEGREMFLDIPQQQLSKQDFPEVIAGYCAEFAAAHPIEYKVEVDGQPTSLDPIVAAELGKIAREAIYNAFRHSKAESIEVEVTYGKRAVQIRVRDNGQGFEQALLQGNSGHLHLGLQNMKKRAERLGAEFRLWSRLGSGTELEIVLASQRAYVKTQRRWMFFGSQYKG